MKKTLLAKEPKHQHGVYVSKLSEAIGGTVVPSEVPIHDRLQWHYSNNDPCSRSGQLISRTSTASSTPMRAPA
jgi:hypothetical protein